MAEQARGARWPTPAPSSYDKKWSKLGLNSLDFRRIRGDLIETYRILKECGQRFKMISKSSNAK